MYKAKKQSKNLLNEISVKTKNNSTTNLEILKKLFELKEKDLITKKKEFVENKEDSSKNLRLV